MSERGPNGEAAESVDPLELLTSYQAPAVLAAAVETGVADALAAGAAAADELAEACDADAGATRALLGAMAALGLARRDGDGRFSLTPAGATLARAHPESIAGIVAKEWFFYHAWAGLPESIRDGHARIAPWRERLREDPEQSLAFLRALDDLASRFGGELPGLTELRRGGRLLDAGGGAGSHAAALAAAVPGVEPTVLDLPEVEAVLRERHPELPFLAGDLEAPRFGRPEGESWDYVLLANILHDHEPARCAAIVAEAAGVLAPAGTLLVYEWVIDEDRVSPPEVALFALMMLVENEGGGTYTAGEIGAWMRDAGLLGVTHRRGAGPISVVRATRPEA